MRLLHTLLFVLIGFISFGQILTPAKWSYSASNQAPAVGDEIDLIFSATIEDNWYLYSSEFPCEDGPIKTTVTFKPHASYKLVGGLKAINPLAKHDDVFDCDVKIFKHKGEFRQKIKVLNASLVIDGEAEYQTCSDIDGKCIPFNDEFSFNNIRVSGQKKVTRLLQTPL
ncbi:MAG: protein-disulfide reductase DsbD domain-containing protein [Bacteroidota bacterium]